jgi:VanZ family protein
MLPEGTKLALHTTGRLHLLLHFSLFFLLGALSILSSARTWVRLLLLVTAILLGLSIEYVEALHFGNLFELGDFVTDIYGVLFGALISHVFSREAL